MNVLLSSIAPGMCNKGDHICNLCIHYARIHKLLYTLYPEAKPRRTEEEETAREREPTTPVSEAETR